MYTILQCYVPLNLANKEQLWSILNTLITFYDFNFHFL